ncbi:hypothetical protein Tco_0727436 [Tanacetum coccineum]|uniref:Uncharacterized protein n=1 Tax=Tanacetum coccineum TaxID=301880 RepID=A0ABQ4YJB0_9ASTR
MAKLIKENKTLKRHYKELSDSIKTTRAKTIENTTSLIAHNAEFKAQLQTKGFAIAALKNKLRKLTGTSSELRIHDHNNEPSSSKLVSKVVPPADKTVTSRQELELLFHHHITMLRLYDGGSILFQLKSDSLPHAHA